MTWEVYILKATVLNVSVKLAKLNILLFTVLMEIIVMSAFVRYNFAFLYI